MRRKLLAGLALALVGMVVPTGVSQAGPGIYLLYNKVTGKCADVPGNGPGTVDGPVNQYTCRMTGDNQFWRLAYDQPTGTYQMVNAVDGLCLDLPYYGSVEPGTRVTEYHCRGTEDNQHFRFVEGELGRWFVHVKSGLCLDVEGPATGGDNARLALWPCSTTDDHFWEWRTYVEPS